MNALPNTTHTFAALCGAIVAITKDPRVTTVFSYRWTCLGCGDGPDHGDSLTRVRKAANEHAATCRALPKPTA